MTGSRHTVYLPLIFFILGCVCLFLSRHEPLRDFGNYYYGSRLLLDGKFSPGIYTDIHFFNQQIAAYGETNYFENYIPVPPFTALFYLPFCFFSSLAAKLIFNVVSLCLFCGSLFRLLQFLKAEAKALYLLPLILFFPLYATIQQGQAYLLIQACLFEIYRASEKKQVLYPSLLIGLIISLKIFPGIVLLYFVLKKNWRVVSTSILVFLLLSGLAILVLPQHTGASYFTTILPRLFDNDVVGTYYTGNQSFYTLLLHLFTYDGLGNPNPLIDQPLLAVILESVFYAFLLCVCFDFLKRNNFLVFGCVMFAGFLLSRYSTSYGLLLIMPLCLALLSKELPAKALVLIVAGVVLASLPAQVVERVLPIPFVRLYGLLILLTVMLFHFRFRLPYKLFVLCLVPVFILKYLSFPVKQASYFSIQNSKGLLYDIAIKTDSLILKSCLGYHDVVEAYPLQEKASFSKDLTIRENKIYYKGQVVCSSKDNKAQVFLYGNAMVFMSDLNQGIRFYKLRTLPL